jgi:hypothetical protein
MNRFLATVFAGLAFVSPACAFETALSPQQAAINIAAGASLAASICPGVTMNMPLAAMFLFKAGVTARDDALFALLAGATYKIANIDGLNADAFCAVVESAATKRQIGYFLRNENWTGVFHKTSKVVRVKLSTNQPPYM